MSELNKKALSTPQYKTGSSSVIDFCKRHGFTPCTYYRQLKKGNMPPLRHIGGSSRILDDEEQGWLERVKAGETADTAKEIA